MKQVHLNKFDKAHLKVNDLRRRIKHIQMQENFTIVLKLNKLKRIIWGELKHWSRVEESILKQRARINWLKLDDTNIKFFFVVTKANYAKIK